MRKIELTLDIRPQPVQSIRQGITKMGKKVFHHDPKKAKYKRDLELLVRSKANPKHKIHGPVMLEVYYLYSPTKGIAKKHLPDIIAGNWIYKDTIPDVSDNLNKPVVDALKGIVMEDDAKVVLFKGGKFYAKRNQILIRVYELNKRNNGVIRPLY